MYSDVQLGPKGEGEGLINFSNISAIITIHIYSLAFIDHPIKLGDKRIVFEFSETTQLHPVPSMGVK